MSIRMINDFYNLRKQNVFGGGRYDFQVDTIPLDMEAFIEELTAAQEEKTKEKTKTHRA